MFMLHNSITCMDISRSVGALETCWATAASLESHSYNEGIKMSLKMIIWIWIYYYHSYILSVSDSRFSAQRMQYSLKKRELETCQPVLSGSLLVIWLFPIRSCCSLWLPSQFCWCLRCLCSHPTGTKRDTWEYPTEAAFLHGSCQLHYSKHLTTAWLLAQKCSVLINIRCLFSYLCLCHYSNSVLRVFPLLSFQTPS